MAATSNKARTIWPRRASVGLRLWLVVSSAVLTGPAVGLAAAAPSWQSTLSKEPPGDFPPLRPLHASYVFGWAGLTAAAADVEFSRTPQDRFRIEGSGRTTGLVRALWRYNVNYLSLANAENLRPIESNQMEMVRSKRMTTHLRFSGTGVLRSRTESPGDGLTKTREFLFPNLFDLQSAMLYLRSQPLKDRTSQRVVVYPATNAYLVTTTVVDREAISVRAGHYNAIKLDLQLKKIGKDLELLPHRKFRRASIWVSDDADRLILRIEAQIFIGTIFAELQTIRFDKPAP